MTQFTYTITDPSGIHARPASVLVKLANGFKSKITVLKGEKSADLKRIFSLMALCAKQGDELTVQIEGEDETQAQTEILNCFKENF